MPAPESQLAESPLAFRVGDKTYSADHVQIGDLWALSKWIRDERAEAALRLRGRFPPDQLVQLVARVIEREPTQRERLEAQLSPEGGAWLLWRGVQRRHPEVTFEQVLTWCNADAALRERFLIESGLVVYVRAAQPNAEAAPPDPTQGGPQPTGSPKPPSSTAGSDLAGPTSAALPGTVTAG